MQSNLSPLPAFLCVPPVPIQMLGDARGPLAPSDSRAALHGGFDMKLVSHRLRPTFQVESASGTVFASGTVVEACLPNNRRNGPRDIPATPR